MPLRSIIAPTLLLVAVTAGLVACASTGDPGTAGRFQIYGNWCGPGHPKAGTNPPPINQVDEHCRSHDQCYANNGYLNRLCDNQLISRLESVQTTDPAEEAARLAIIEYFVNSPKVD